MFDGIFFEYPFAALLIIPFILCAKFCKMRLTALYFPHTEAFLKNSVSLSRELFFLKWLGVVMLIVALMSPVKEESYEPSPREGYEIALILDASESMKAEGFDAQNRHLNRFDAVKEIVSDFIDKRARDNMGLVVFGAYSFIASPLTYDAAILKTILSQLHIGVAGKYTALNTSLAQGVNLLKQGESKTKIAILLTDGHSTKEIEKISLETALEMVKKEKIKVYPIGIGMPHEYNKEVLLKIAQESGGVAFGALNASELKEVYKKIDELAKSEIKNEKFSYLNYYYRYALFISLLALMLYVYLRNKRGLV